MRRLLLLLLPLLAGLLVVPSPTPARAADRPVVRLTDADAGRTVHVLPGTRVEVRLASPGEGDVWRGLERGAPTLHLVRYRTSGTGLEADLDALSPEAGPEARGQLLTAETENLCQRYEPACGRPSRSWRATVAVDDGPADASDVACTPGPRAQPSPAPGQVYATAADDGRTVQVPRFGVLVLYLDGCAEPAWSPPQADRLLFRSSADLDRSTGAVTAVFTPAASGTATVTAGVDARCLHRTDASGDGTCAVVQRAFSLTVEVGPSPTPSACLKPTYEGFRATPATVAPGEAVTVSGGRDDLCVDDADEPEHDFVLRARPQGGTETTVASGRARYFSGTVRPVVTTSYRLLMDGRALRTYDSGAGTEEAVVTVDRGAGACATALSLTGPARAAAGSTVQLVGRAAPGERVDVLFRRYGEAAYTVRRSLVADSDGRLTTTWTATDDHRWYARTTRCDSPAGLTKAAPVVTGPALVRRGATVVLRVRAVEGVRTTVFFRGAGEAFSARRTLTGSGTVRYVARSDQRYYALTRDTPSAPGLTQVR